MDDGKCFAGKIKIKIIIRLSRGNTGQDGIAKVRENNR